MRHFPALLACALLLSGPIRAQEEEGGEQAAEEPSSEISAPEAPAPAPLRRAGPAFRPGERRAPAPAVGSGGGSAPARISGDGDGGQSLGGAGLGRAEPDDSRSVPVRPGGVPPMRELGGGGASAGGAGFQEIDIGLIPTIGQLRNTGSGADRPVITLAGGKKWAIRMKHRGPGIGQFPLLLGGTNGDLTGGGKYRYRAALSKQKGVVSGPGALCAGEMIVASYVTCEQPCSMKWELRFGPTAKGQNLMGLCVLDNDQLYYLNVAPEGNGCSGGQAAGNGCPLVMEVANGGTLQLNPSGVAAACSHRGFGSDGRSCR